MQKQNRLKQLRRFLFEFKWIGSYLTINLDTAKPSSDFS